MADLIKQNQTFLTFILKEKHLTIIISYVDVCLAIS